VVDLQSSSGLARLPVPRETGDQSKADSSWRIQVGRVQRGSEAGNALGGGSASYVLHRKVRFKLLDDDFRLFDLEKI
jgi:hypothetical protein